MELMNDDNAPYDFQISSSSSDGSDVENFASFDRTGFLEGGKKCPLCFRLKNTFTCKECLLKGEFNHSSPVAGRLRERYCDLKLKLLKLRRKRNELAGQCSVYTQRREQIVQIIDEIENYQNTALLEKELKSCLQQRIADVEREAESIRKSTTEKEKRWPLYRSRLDNMAAQHRHKMAKLQKFSTLVQGRKELLKSVSKSRILQLKEYVFPMQEVNGQNRDLPLDLRSSFEDDDEDDTVSALMVATSNYWGRPDELVSSFGTCHGFGLLGPTLPASGDYSAHNMWADSSQGLHTQAPGQEPTRNPAHCISAALTYVTQFVNLVAYYLDLRLPHRLSFSEFTNERLVGGNFNRKVAKLNANVIHLCASQGIPSTFLQPRLTISNLLTLFDTELADLGRRGPFEVATQLAKSMEESIEKDLVICDGDSSDSDADCFDNNFPSDWENVQRGTITEEMSAQNMTNHNQSYFQSIPYQSDLFTRSKNTTTTTGGLVSSFTSFFRGWGK